MRARARGGLRRGAYLLPSLFTIGNMVLGFYADRPRPARPASGIAALLVFIAAFLDTLRRADRPHDRHRERVRQGVRLAGRRDHLRRGAGPARPTSGACGAFDRDAWLLSVFFMVCTATRLARFNVQTKVVDSRYFVGLPVAGRRRDDLLDPLLRARVPRSGPEGRHAGGRGHGAAADRRADGLHLPLPQLQEVRPAEALELPGVRARSRRSCWSSSIIPRATFLAIAVALHPLGAVGLPLLGRLRPASAAPGRTSRPWTPRPAALENLP